MTRSPAAARTALFVPGNRPDRFAKAAAAGADLVLIDLEDAVPAADKAQARTHTDAWLAAGHPAAVRVNAHGTPWFDDDLAMASRHGCPIMVPKCQDVDALTDLVSRSAGRCHVIALIETALGIEHATRLCATPGVVRAALGNADLATQLGVDPGDHLALAYSRSRLVAASAAAGIAPPLDGVTTRLDDPGTLASDIAHARRLGFAGKLCIHPSQLPATADGFASTEEELTWARSVLNASDGASRVGGEMVDRPVLERARRLLANA